MLDKEEIRRWERLTDAMLDHAAADDPAAFAQVVDVLNRAYAQLPDVAARLRENSDDKARTGAPAYSWSDLAAALGITRQGAQQRYGRTRTDD